MCENILLKASLEHGGQTSIMISPTFAQAKKVYKELVKALRNTDLIKAKNASDLEITFINDSVILFKSAEQGDNLRGFTVSKYGILIFDEAAYISDDVFYLCTPFVNAHNAPILMVSTPRFKSGFFYEFYEDGMRGQANCFSYDFCEYENPYLSKERLELYRRKMPLNLFLADYLGRWMEAMSDIFGDFKHILSNTITQDVGDLVGGLDWGVGRNAKSEDSDSTALSIFNQHKQQVRLYHWNDLDETQTIEAIVAAVREYGLKKLVVETNSIGSVYLGMLRKAIAKEGLPCSIIAFNTNNSSKRSVIEKFIVAVQNRECQLLDEAEMKIQMSAYQMEKTATGLITYNATKGYHDDCIIATALALHGLATAQYCVH